MNFQLNTSNGGMLTQAAGHTISGWGTINAALNNQGLVNANSNGNGFTCRPTRWPTPATMEATGGGTLIISTITVNNAGGTILASGGNVQIWRHGRRRHAHQHGHVDLSLYSGGGTLSGVTLSNGSWFNILWQLHIDGHQRDHQQRHDCGEFQPVRRRTS